jgi:hypothetical protein
LLGSLVFSSLNSSLCSAVVKVSEGSQNRLAILWAAFFPWGYVFTAASLDPDGAGEKVEGLLPVQAGVLFMTC